ncbi:MAG TPA: DNA repair protein RecN, partial [Verrucomicrobiales bacterium]|nr:DNA repair protein RecN [Verrucomicrobiales bacterium]
SLGPQAAVVAPLLEENGIDACEGDQLLVRRAFTAAGTNRQFVNGSPTTIAVLKQLGELLVDIHGPHDHQSLLHPARQLAILDAFGGLEERRGRVAELVRTRAKLEAAKAGLIIDEKTHAQKLELLRHQSSEIAAARFQPGEESELEAEHTRASNSARLQELTQAALGALGESESSLLDQAGELGRTLHDLTRTDPGAEPIEALHRQALENLRELQGELNRYADRVEVNPERLAELDERLNLLQSMKRKYGATIEEINAFGEEAARQLAALESRETELVRLNAEEKRLQKELAAAANELSAARRKLLPKLGAAVTAQLQELGFARSHFEVTLSSGDEITATGWDHCEFQFAPNVGEPPHPLRAIASSGEMSRVMLALKTVLAAQDEVPVLVFDEIDANVGGETATVVGRKMAEIGARRQVLCITHLPAVAAAAATHLEVRKQVKDGRTLSSILRLEGRARSQEIARMLGGVSDAALKHAEALLDGGRTKAKTRSSR